MQDLRSLFRWPRLAAALFAGAVASTGALAAVDDINATSAFQPREDLAPAPAAKPRGKARDKAAAAPAKAVPAGPKVAALPPEPAPAAPAPAVNERAADLVARAGTRPDADAVALAAPAQAEPPLGARWRVLHGGTDINVPVVSWMADMQPAGSGTSILGSTATKPSVHLSAEWALPGDFSLGVMPGMAVDLDALGRRVANGTLAVTVGKAWTPQWRTFVDMARDRLAADSFGDVSTTLDAGVTFIAGPSTQIAVALTHGLTVAAPPFQAGVGVSSSF